MTAPILLASASPRRRRLMALLGVGYDCASVDVPEEVPAGPVDPAEFATGLAADKAHAARLAFGGEALVLSADTIVVRGDEILGKPADVADAVRMLRALSGDVHRVVTAVALLPAGAAEPVVEAVVSNVRMRALDDAAIRDWVDRGELLGCAGAYNIEGHLADVDLDECYQNVAGLPLCHVYLMLTGARVPPEGPLSPVAALDRSCSLGRELLG